jgi:MraZ protein
MFIGQHRIAIDKRRRFSLPSEFSIALASGAIVTQGFDHNLLVLTESVFQELHDRFMAMNIADPLARLLIRLIVGNAAPLQTDRSGRAALPDHLREFARINQDAVLVGQGDYIEIWTPESWSAQMLSLRDAQENSRRFAALDISRK